MKDKITVELHSKIENVINDHNYENNTDLAGYYKPDLDLLMLGHGFIPKGKDYQFIGI